MTQNMFYGGDDYDLETGGFCPVADGCPEALHRIAACDPAAAPTSSACRRPSATPRALADLLGWYASPRAHVISRYPIIDPPDSHGIYVFVEPAPGRVVAVANLHLPSDAVRPVRGARRRDAGRRC